MAFFVVFRKKILILADGKFIEKSYKNGKVLENEMNAPLIFDDVYTLSTQEEN